MSTHGGFGLRRPDAKHCTEFNGFDTGSSAAHIHLPLSGHCGYHSARYTSNTHLIRQVYVSDIVLVWNCGIYATL